jgi:hypothetical protein
MKNVVLKHYCKLGMLDIKALWPILDCSTPGSTLDSYLFGICDTESIDATDRRSPLKAGW